MGGQMGFGGPCFVPSRYRDPPIHFPHMLLCFGSLVVRGGGSIVEITQFTLALLLLCGPHPP